MQLTRREKEVLKYISLPINQIAKRMDLSKGTVVTYINGLRNKLQANSCRMILAQALKQNFVSIDELITE